MEREQERERERERQERERTIAKVGELEEEIRQRERMEREQERERERERQERERIITRLEEEIRKKEQREIATTERMRELEEIVIRKDENFAKANQTIQRLSGEIELLNEQLIFEKKKYSSQVKNGTNIPKQVTEIFKNDKIPVFKRKENQSSELLDEFNKKKESKSMITQHLEDLMIEGKISIGCSDCLLWPDVLDYVSMICEVEKLVADKVEKQVKDDYEGFSEWNDDPDTVKLTLTFNIFGLSPVTIEKFSEVDGAVFDQDIFDLCSTYGMDDWETILDLGYIQMMLRSNNLPCRNHLKTCTVCCCSTPKELENVMREHKLEFDFDLLERKKINGPRFIANTLWVKKCGEKVDQKLLLKAFRTVKKLHKIDDY